MPGLPDSVTDSASRMPRLTGLGLGSSSFGNLYRESSDAESRAVVDAAWQAGVRYFDTAPHYGLGLAERRLGAALAGRPRDEYVLSTKVGRLLVPNPGGADRLDDEGFVVRATTRRVWDFSRDGILRSVEQSLERLSLDRIDIAYLHDPDEHWVEASTSGIGALIELREQGVLRGVGAGMNQTAMLAEFIRRADVDAVMVAGRYTLLDQSAADELLPLAEERGVAVVAAAVYNSGILSTSTPSADGPFDYGRAPAEVLQRAEAIAALCRSFGVELPAAALAFPLRHPSVVSVVVGAATAEQFDETAVRFRAAIPDALWERLEADGLIRRGTGSSV